MRLGGYVKPSVVVQIQQHIQLGIKKVYKKFKVTKSSEISLYDLLEKQFNVCRISLKVPITPDLFQKRVRIIFQRYYF